MCRDGPPVFARTAAQTMALSDPGTPIERKKHWVPNSTQVKLLL